MEFEAWANLLMAAQECGRPDIAKIANDRIDAIVAQARALGTDVVVIS